MSRRDSDSRFDREESSPNKRYRRDEKPYRHKHDHKHRHSAFLENGDHMKLRDDALPHHQPSGPLCTTNQMMLLNYPHLFLLSSMAVLGKLVEALVKGNLVSGDGGRTQGFRNVKGHRQFTIESREMRNHKLNWMIILSNKGEARRDGFPFRRGYGGSASNSNYRGRDKFNGRQGDTITEKRKHDMYQEVNKDPIPQKEDDPIAKLEAHLAS